MVIEEMVQNTIATITQIDEALVGDPSSYSKRVMHRSLQKRQQSLESLFTKGAAIGKETIYVPMAGWWHL